MNNDRYPIKVQAVKMLEAGQSRTSICKELHVDPVSLDLWYAIYLRGGELALYYAKHVSHRTAEEKLPIVKEVIEKGLSLRRVSALYEVPVITIKRWLRAYQQYGEAGLRRKNAAGTMAKKKVYTPEQLDELETLRRRNEYLEAENALLKKVKALVEEREARLRATGRKPSKD